MATRAPLVRLLTAVALGLIACVFVSFYSDTSWIIFGRDRPLYLAPGFMIHYGRYAYGVPTLVLACGLILLRRLDQKLAAFEILLSLAWLSAFAWILATIWAWQVARIEIIN
jgi:hypothetical protein